MPSADVRSWKPSDRVSYPATTRQRNYSRSGRARPLWKLPPGLDAEKAAWACIARYGMGASIRAGLTLGRSAAVLGLGIIGQFALRCLRAAGAFPVIGIDSVLMRREAAKHAGAEHVIDPGAADTRQQLRAFLGTSGAEIVADATGIPDAVPVAMSLACDAGQVVVVGSPRGKAKDVNPPRRPAAIGVTGARQHALRPGARAGRRWDIRRRGSGCWQRWPTATQPAGWCASHPARRARHRPGF